MAINFASAFSKKVQEAFKKESITDSAAGNEYSFAGNRTIYAYSVDVVPLNEYKRTGANRYGEPQELGDTVQEMTMRDDKAFTMTIDKGNNSDQMNIKGATRALKRETEQVVIPYMDKYRLKEWALNAGIIDPISSEPAKNTIVSLIFDADEKMSDALVPAKDRTIFIPNKYFKLLALSDEFIGIDDLGKKSVSRGEVGTICDMMVKRVPSSYMPADAYFMIKYKGSTVDPVKLNETHIHQDPPGISGNLLEGRFYHDSFVLSSKANGIYVAAKSSAVTAAPTISDSSGTVTISGTGTVKYTTDGSDPRSSKNAKVYSGTFSEEAGVVVKAVAYGSGTTYPSSIKEYTVVG